MRFLSVEVGFLNPSIPLFTFVGLGDLLTFRGLVFFLRSVGRCVSNFGFQSSQWLMKWNVNLSLLRDFPGHLLSHLAIRNGPLCSSFCFHHTQLWAGYGHNVSQDGHMSDVSSSHVGRKLTCEPSTSRPFLSCPIPLKLQFRILFRRFSAWGFLTFGTPTEPYWELSCESWPHPPSARLTLPICFLAAGVQTHHLRCLSYRCPYGDHFFPADVSSMPVGKSPSRVLHLWEHTACAPVLAACSLVLVEDEASSCSETRSSSCSPADSTRAVPRQYSTLSW